MKTRVPIAIVAVVFLLLPWAAASQQQKPQASAPTVVLEYFENASGNLAIFDAGKKSVDFDIGTRVLPGWTVVTDRGDVAELKLDPNGSIIRISQMTNFKVESLQSTGDDANAFSVAIGKIRTVAGKATGKEKYTVRGLSGVCGVRGTDFGMEVGTESELAFVLDGLIDFTKLATGETIQLSKGMMADSMAAVFIPAEIPADMLDGIKKDLDFQKLDPQEVPGHALAEAPGGEAPAPGGEAPVASAAAPAAPGAEAPAPPKEPAGPAKPGPLDGIFAWLRNILGMEIGAITIDDVTYSKLVLTPQFAFGPLKLGLYLPLIYTTNMFDFSTYYKPAGNNEWDFGFTGGPWDPLDALSDLMLKIKYIEWGNQRDPFFFKFGNLDDITIGHGLIMRDFANDADFPAVRRIGLNVGLDAGFLGLEAMVNDAALPEIMGGRINVRPIPGFKAALGLSLLMDLNPAAALDETLATLVGNPIFFNPGVDIDLPFIETDPLAIIAFADIAGMVPYLRDPIIPFGSPVPAGLHLESLWDSSAATPLRNFGIAAGLMGNILMIDYRLEYRYFTGIFQPTFYNALYERSSRTQDALMVATYLGAPHNPAFDTLQMGIYGEGGFTWEKILSLKIGYFWPWAYDATGALVPDPNDHFLVEFTLEKGVIPIVNLSGSVSYERNKFISTILQSEGAEGLGLFDANTVVSAQLVYSVTENLDVMLLYTTTAALDEEGNVIYENPSALLPKMNTTISIETSVHF